MILDRIKQLVSSQLGIAEDEITLETRFIDDLGADSLDVMEMVMAFELEFGIEVDETALESIRQVKDVVAYFEALQP
ncbi:MAG: acyl carrier protein [Eubacteriaceae bacterium]|nr:acyl carrier protein [Eubacteriaceae bacterium]